MSISDMYFEKFHRACQFGAPAHVLDKMYGEWKAQEGREKLFALRVKPDGKGAKILSWNA